MADNISDLSTSFLENIFGDKMHVRGTFSWTVYLSSILFFAELVIFIPLSKVISSLDYPFLGQHKNLSISCYFFVPQLLLLGYSIFYKFAPWIFVTFRKKKTTLVLAYNLMASLDDLKFERKYNRLIEDLKNKIAQFDLGDYLVVEKAPSNIRFPNNKAAEAKTMLGLRGGVLLAWGSVTKENRHYKFVTRFSYEFGYPSGVREESAGDVVNDFLSRAFQDGWSIPYESFSETVSYKSLYILGITAATLNMYEKAELFLETYRNSCNSEKNPLKKKVLGPSYLLAGNVLINVYKAQIPKPLNGIFGKDSEFALSLSSKILLINPEDYDALIISSYVKELYGDTVSAKQLNKQASMVSPRGASAHILNNAYFLIGEHRYSESLQMYTSMQSISREIDMADVCNFLYKKFQSTGNLGYLFADAYLEFKFRSEKEGASRGKQFLDLAKNMREYSDMNSVMIRLLGLG